MARKKAIHIEPPPKELGLYRVVYVIDVGAGNVIEAAMNAYEIMSDSDSLPPVLEVIDNKGNKIKIDLSKRKEIDMLNKTFEMIEEVLNSIDVGGEQSRQFAEEIKILRDLIGYPQLNEDMLSEIQRRDYLAVKLRRLAIEAEGLKASLPTLPINKWFDGTVEDATIDVFFDEYELSKLLYFIADVGVSHSV